MPTKRTQTPRAPAPYRPPDDHARTDPDRGRRQFTVEDVDGNRFYFFHCD